MKLIQTFFSKPLLGKNKSKLNSSKINNIDISCTVVHTGRVLTKIEIDQNRSSKYSYLKF